VIVSRNRQARIIKGQSIGLENEQIQRYREEVMALIEAQKYYPRILRKMRREGEVQVEFTLQQDGSMIDLKVLGNIGHHLFQNAALGAFERVDSFPSFPDGTDSLQWTFTIALKYNLAR